MRLVNIIVLLLFQNAFPTLIEYNWPKGKVIARQFSKSQDPPKPNERIQK